MGIHPQTPNNFSNTPNIYLMFEQWTRKLRIMHQFTVSKALRKRLFLNKPRGCRSTRKRFPHAPGQVPESVARLAFACSYKEEILATWIQ